MLIFRFISNLYITSWLRILGNRATSGEIEFVGLKNRHRRELVGHEQR
jgi:ABC-type antimicrobial peptide transport system ATPase subunit